MCGEGERCGCGEGEGGYVVMVRGVNMWFGCGVNVW